MNDEVIARIFSRINNMSPEEREARAAELEKEEQAHAARMKLEAYWKSGAPERYQNESLDTYTVTNDMQRTGKNAAAGYVQDVKRGLFKTLVLIGTAGTGKTHLACAVIRETGGKYRTAAEIVEEIRRAKSFSADETEAEILRKYARCEVLVIDEIGRGISATDEKYMLYQVLNARYNARKPTVLVSNFKKAEFLQYIGVAVADRLVESAEMYELIGDSYRRELRGAV